MRKKTVTDLTRVLYDSIPDVESGIRQNSYGWNIHHNREEHHTGYICIL